MAIWLFAVFSLCYMRDDIVEANGRESFVVGVPFLTVVGEVDDVLAGGTTSEAAEPPNGKHEPTTANYCWLTVFLPQRIRAFSPSGTSFVLFLVYSSRSLLLGAISFCFWNSCLDSFHTAIPALYRQPAAKRAPHFPLPHSHNNACLSRPVSQYARDYLDAQSYEISVSRHFNRRLHHEQHGLPWSRDRHRQKGHRE